MNQETKLLADLFEHDRHFKEVNDTMKMVRHEMGLAWTKETLGIEEGLAILIKGRVQSKRFIISKIHVKDYLMNSDYHIDVSVKGWLVRDSDNYAYKYETYLLFSSFYVHKRRCVEFVTKGVRQEYHISKELISELYKYNN